MEIEKTTTLKAPIERIWRFLLDPEIMRHCVPGVESVDMLSETDFVVGVRVKIAFVSARFKIRGAIIEQRPPSYLRSTGTGEDSTLTSSLKQSSEVFLSARGDGTVELRTRANVEVLGRLGSFGINMLKTKADRMWEEFGANLAARLDAEAQGAPSS